MRLIRQLIAVMRSSENRLEYDVIARQVAREEQAVRGAAGEAANVVERLARVRAAVAAAMIDARTPGVIDASEAPAIQRELGMVHGLARQHTGTLEALT